ncbi:hypothetical protein [Gordonia sp. ABSL49_1]|uniref:hypothetical protein n=1 Tax=Gordonia sp. ABSL49_1 TaxID=2920941 RepID=UPI001F10EA7A|nr:hypothetical protein [Gordonia sp. ABSL49_1]MCH5643233.1 hypothetical protein [Gordonia sp. ABSL49_1]
MSTTTPDLNAEAQYLFERERCLLPIRLSIALDGEICVESTAFPLSVDQRSTIVADAHWELAPASASAVDKFLDENGRHFEAIITAVSNNRVGKLEPEDEVAADAAYDAIEVSVAAFEGDASTATATDQYDSSAISADTTDAEIEDEARAQQTDLWDTCGWLVVGIADALRDDRDLKREERAHDA